ncbi:MAG: hypothetical protein ACI85U_002699 [Candidatus Promineifilaceae bacterium]|jgi:hypothetical protein
MPKFLISLPAVLFFALVALIGCQPSQPANLPALPTSAALATVENLPTAASVAQLLPTFTPAPIATSEIPAVTQPTSGPVNPEVTESNEGASLPSLLATATPLPTATATATATSAPTSTPEPISQIPGLPPFESGPVNLILGSGFGPEVRNNDRLDYVKIGFHDGPGGDSRGISEWMQSLDAQGIPFFLKSVDDGGVLFEAQNIAKASGVPHVLVYRRSGNDFELPNYNDNPIEAAHEHWQKHLDAFPPELDPSMVWIESANEVDKDQSEWMARYSLEIAKIAVRDGYKYAAFAWSSGEPEYTDWKAPAMAEFLRFAAENPDQVAVALHEYSYKNSDLFREYPFLVGRFQLLFLAADQMGIRRPTVLITEFGWEYVSLPGAEEALAQMQAAAELYAQYPEVKGAAIWYLGGGYSDISLRTRRLFEPLTQFAGSRYYERPPYPPIDPAIFRDYWEREGIVP